VKNIILDCGSNLGQGYEKFREILNLNDTYVRVYMFEPNVNCYDILCEKYSDNNEIQIYNKAIWDKKEERILNVERTGPWKESEGRQGEIGGSSNILQEDFIKPRYIKDEYMSEWPPKYKQTASCIDLSKCIKDNFDITDNIHLKLDIEGAEFRVLEKLIKDDTISYLNTLAIEWHDEMIKVYTKDTVTKYKEKIKQKLKEYGANIDWLTTGENDPIHDIPGQMYRLLTWHIGCKFGDWELVPGFDPDLGFNEKEFVKCMYKYKIRYMDWD
jgi:FkbM family methyltransferase